MDNETGKNKTFWFEYLSKSKRVREKYFDSLSRSEQEVLKKSFWDDGWYELVLQNEVDETLDYVKEMYKIDLIDLRIRALKGEVFNISKSIWEHIEQLLLEYGEIYNTDIIFGGLVVCGSDKDDRYYCIKRKRAYV